MKVACCVLRGADNSNAVSLLDYELSSKASWRKLHLAINQAHYIEACILTDRSNHDDRVK